MRPMRSAFSVVELLVVISIIVLLIALLIPALGAAREQARQAMCLGNQRQITAASLAYTNDHDGEFPLNETAAPFAMTSRSGWVGWADARPRFNPYLTDASALYCPSGGDTQTCPNIDNFRDFTIDAGSQGWNKLAGWDAIPIGVDTDFYVHIDYSVFPGFVRKSNRALVTLFFGPNEEVSELSGFGWSQPTVPQKVARVKTPSDVPMSADMAYTLNPAILTPLVDGPFVFWDNPYANPGHTTILKSHLTGTRGFNGIGTAFVDGHAQWRPPGVAGPRTGVLTGGSSYDYVQWY